MSGIYDRQGELNLKIPESASVIGVGGVGSWVALNLALVGVEKIALYDFDLLEESNLNRTPYKLSQVGMLKVTALAELIAERRPSCRVYPFNKKVETLEDLNLETEIIIDTRDKEPLAGTLITGGYDGEKVTLHFNPNPKHIWGEGEVRYTITPSFLVPPQLIANIITAFVCYRHRLRNSDKEFISNFTIPKFISRFMKKRRRGGK